MGTKAIADLAKVSGRYPLKGSTPGILTADANEFAHCLGCFCREIYIGITNWHFDIDRFTSIVADFNSKANMMGNVIKILFFGPGMSTGTRFHNAKEIVMMSPPERLDYLIQRIGRCLSPESLTDLAGEERCINVTILYSIHNAKFISEIGEHKFSYEQRAKDKVREFENLGEMCDVLLQSIQKNESNVEGIDEHGYEIIGGARANNYEFDPADLLPFF